MRCFHRAAIELTALAAGAGIGPLFYKGFHWESPCLFDSMPCNRIMDFKLPMLGEGADSGVVVTLHVKVGDSLKKDQPVLDLESEKAVASIPSTVDGVVSGIHVKEGDKISVGARILSVSVDGKPEPAAAAPEAPETAPASAPVPAAQTASPAIPVPLPSGMPPAASPSIRKMASEIGLDLTRIRGSGRGGRIELGDVRLFIQQLQALAFSREQAEAAPARPAVESVDFSKWGPVLKKPVTPLRGTIARRMVQNWNAIPHVTQFEEATSRACWPCARNSSRPMKRREPGSR